MYENMGTGGKLSPDLDAWARRTTKLNGPTLKSGIDTFLSSPQGEKKLIAIRQDLHAHPETGYQEFRSTRRVRTVLEVAGLETRTLSGGTGLICTFGPETNIPMIALRAELDALRVQEETDVDFRSKVARVAHACGHDVHMVETLGTGLFLAMLHRYGLLPGQVRLIFEPAEEKVPSGALKVIAEGGIEGVKRIFAYHCWPHLPVGKFGLCVGPVTAACDMVEITVIGRGGHTSRMHLTGDPVRALTTIVRLVDELSRRFDTRSAPMVGWGQIHSGEGPNSVSSQGVMEGTIRGWDNEALAGVPEMVKQVATLVAEMYGVEVRVAYKTAVPATVNDAKSVQLFRDSATYLLGPDSVVENVDSKGGDSLGHYLKLIDGAYFWQGTDARTPAQKAEGGVHPDLHTPGYLPGNNVIRHGVMAMAGTVLHAQGVEF